MFYTESYELGVLLFATYLIGTFGSALAVIYAWNASNTSGHTKKGIHNIAYKLNVSSNSQTVTINAMTLVAFALGNIAGEHSDLHIVNGEINIK